jgi:hypothetical protein
MCPIKGLTENRRLIRIGKIHLGIKVEKLDSRTGEPVYNTRGEIITYPKATDYFVCPPEVQAVYGEKPDRLDVIIPVEDDEISFFLIKLIIADIERNPWLSPFRPERKPDISWQPPLIPKTGLASFHRERE